MFIEFFCSNYFIAAALTAFKFNLELMTHETNIGILKINATKKNEFNTKKYFAKYK